MLAPMVIAALLGSASGDDTPPRSPAEGLTRASAIRRQSFGKDGEEKIRILQQAAGAYEEVAGRWPDDRAAAAEGWFRAGEIRRSLRNVEEARRCFEAATAVPDETRFGARATNELGHLARRLKDYEEALKQYRAVAEAYPKERLECARALTWQGKVMLLIKRVDEGHQLLLSVGKKCPEFPVEDIRNTDLVAQDWIEMGRPQEARELVTACIERHQIIPEGEDDIAKDIKKALATMKSRAPLGLAAPVAKPDGDG